MTTVGWSATGVDQCARWVGETPTGHYDAGTDRARQVALPCLVESSIAMTLTLTLLTLTKTDVTKTQTTKCERHDHDDDDDEVVLVS